MSQKLFPNQRTLFLLVHIGNWHVGPMPLPANHSLLQSVALRLNWGGAIAKAVQGSGLDDKEMDVTGRLEYYDWDLNSLSEEALVRTVPKPGVVFALDKAFQLRVLDKDGGLRAVDDPDSHAFLLAKLIKDDFPLGGESGKTIHQLHEAVTKFLDTPEANHEPSGFDVFLSYAKPDHDVAEELHDMLIAEGVSCFMAAKELAIGGRWESAIRETLKRAAVCVILLTPNSLGSKWVMCEAGAFWALEKPMVPAFLFADPGSVPEPIASNQGMRIDTHAQRQALCRAVKQLCGY